MQRFGNAAAVRLAVFALLLAAAVVPMLVLGVYTHPAADDFSYGLSTHRAVETGTSVAAAVWEKVSDFYMNWQGSYAAMAVMALNPGVFGEALYFLTPVVLLGFLALGTFKLCDTLVRRMCGGTRSDAFCAGTVVFLLCVELLPSGRDAFYWWNGATYYTLTFGVMLLYADCMLLLWGAESRKRRVLLCVWGVLLSVFLGGNNYVSALLSLELVALFLLACILKKRRLAPHAGLLFAVLAAAFLVNALAPGNAVRQDTLSGDSVVWTLVHAVLKAVADVPIFLSTPLLLVCAASAPFLARLARASGFRFRWPLAALALSFALYVSQNAPHFYAAGTAGPERLRNIVFFSFVWLVFFWIFYISGWLQQRYGAPAWEKTPVRIVELVLCAALLVQLAPVCVWRGITTAEAVCELTEGSATAYDREREARLAVFLDPAVTDVRVAPLSVSPRLIAAEDLNADPNHWINLAAAWYYGKNSVALIE